MGPVAGIALAITSMSSIHSLSRRNWVFLALSGLATGLSWQFYFRALQLGEASRGEARRAEPILGGMARNGNFINELLWRGR